MVRAHPGGHRQRAGEIDFQTGHSRTHARIRSGPNRRALDAGRGVRDIGAGHAAVAIEGRAAAAVVRTRAEVPFGPSPQPFPSKATAATGPVARSQKAAAISSMSISR